jgi:hypothetical protein
MKKVDSQAGPVIAGILLLVLGFALLVSIVSECYRAFSDASPFAYAAIVIVFVIPLGWLLVRCIRTEAGTDR